MPLIRLETFIRAPAVVCFDLSRSIDLHAEAPSPLRHRAVEGVTSGLIGPGEHVTWEGRFFGLPQRMTSKIVAFERPHSFTDEMQRGPFGRWRHTHLFEQREGGTLMTDLADFASPLGPLGAAFDALFLKRFMLKVLLAQNRYLKMVAEGRASAASG